MGIRVLDCTLRDGGHVNKARFGENTIREIVKNLSLAKTDIIEVGFLRNGDFSQEESNFSKIEEVYPFLPENSVSQYSLMIRPDWYDISLLSKNCGKINFLRFAFYYKDLELTKKYAGVARTLGYKFFLNPVNLPGYDLPQLRQLIAEINQIRPFAMTIVDTYGQLEMERLEEIYSCIEENLNIDIAVDFHSHENLNLSFALARHFLNIHNPKREVFVDASLQGMGRMPGNLCTEIIMDYLNEHYAKSYNLDFVLEAIDTHISPLKKIYGWGYCPAYYMSAKLKIHRSYVEFLLEKEVPLPQMRKIRVEVKKTGKGAFFDKELISNLYQRTAL